MRRRPPRRSETALARHEIGAANGWCPHGSRSTPLHRRPLHWPPLRRGQSRRHVHAMLRFPDARSILMVLTGNRRRCIYHPYSLP